MNKIGLFYGSTIGNTEGVAETITEKIGKNNIDIFDIGGTSKEDLEKYNLLILGTSTWNDGDIQDDWEDFLPSLAEIDFSDKTVALFGLGDQFGYADNFIDGVGILYDSVIAKGAKVVGNWPTEGYDYEESKAERDGMFVGLPLDEDNESELTEERIEKWVELIKGNFDL